MNGKSQIGTEFVFTDWFPYLAENRIHAIIKNNDSMDPVLTKRRIQMAELKKLPIGIEDFEKIRQEDFYYVDKTRLIEQLLAQWGEVNLFTRPRRFGKSLNMSMFQHFFEIGSERTLFHGLEIHKIIKYGIACYKKKCKVMMKIEE